MTNRQFQDAIRQYAALTIRKRVSYAPQVAQFADARLQAIDASQETDESKQAAREEVAAVIKNVYLPVDGAFLMSDAIPGGKTYGDINPYPTAWVGNQGGK